MALDRWRGCSLAAPTWPSCAGSIKSTPGVRQLVVRTRQYEFAAPSFASRHWDRWIGWIVQPGPLLHQELTTAKHRFAPTPDQPWKRGDAFLVTSRPDPQACRDWMGMALSRQGCPLVQGNTRDWVTVGPTTGGELVTNGWESAGDGLCFSVRWHASVGLGSASAAALASTASIFARFFLPPRFPLLALATRTAGPTLCALGLHPPACDMYGRQRCLNRGGAGPGQPAWTAKPSARSWPLERVQPVESTAMPSARLLGAAAVRWRFRPRRRC